MVACFTLPKYSYRSSQILSQLTIVVRIDLRKIFVYSYGHVRIEFRLFARSRTYEQIINYSYGLVMAGYHGLAFSTEMQLDHGLPQWRCFPARYVIAVRFVQNVVTLLQLLDSSVQSKQSPPLIVATCSKYAASDCSAEQCTNFAFSKSPILSFYSKKELNFSAIINITSPEELLSDILIMVVGGKITVLPSTKFILYCSSRTG